MDKRLIIISGLSGAGKTVVLETFEDLSYYTIDNLPISLLDTLTRQFYEQNSTLPNQIVIGINAHNNLELLSSLPDKIQSLLDHQITSELIFLDASDEILLHRYSETRRKHPLSSATVSLSDAIEKERQVLSVLAGAANLQINTSHLQLSELRRIVRERIAKRDDQTLSLQIMSFSYKNGIPQDSDFVFDVRCLPNPYWEESLRLYCGCDQAVIDFLLQQKQVQDMLHHLQNFLSNWIPQFDVDQRSYLSIAIGCTGGRHRSVFIAEQLVAKFRATDKSVILKHRDLQS